MMQPKSLAVAVLLALYCTTRVRLTVAERRARKWEARFGAEQGRRGEAEAALARALDRLEEVGGALRLQEEEEEKGRGRLPTIVVGGGGPVRVGGNRSGSGGGGSSSNGGDDIDNRLRAAIRQQRLQQGQEEAVNNGGKVKHAASLNYCMGRRPSSNSNNEDEDDNRRRREQQHQQQQQQHNNKAAAADPDTEAAPKAFSCFPQGTGGPGGAPAPPSLTLLDNCYVRMQVAGGPCSGEALQALTDGLGGALAHGEKAVRGVVHGTVGLAQGLLGSLEGFVDEAAAATSSLSLDALADALGVGGTAGGWSGEGEE